MSRNNNPPKDQVKPADPAPAAMPGNVQKTTPLDEAIERDKAAPTTIKVKPDTKDQLDTLKGVFKLDDYDAVVSRLISTLPQRLSTDDNVVLEMPRSKHNWLISKICHPDQGDCRQCLIDSVR